ncbi:MAG: hypothetical protein ACI4KM_04005 [Oscillospiraceae bacterium]
MRMREVKVFAMYTGFALLFAVVFALMFALLSVAAVGIPSGAMLGILGAAMLLFKADFIVTDLSPTMLMFGGLSAAFFSAMCGLIAIKSGIGISRLFSAVKRRCDMLRGW